MKVASAISLTLLFAWTTPCSSFSSGGRNIIRWSRVSGGPPTTNNWNKFNLCSNTINNNIGAPGREKRLHHQSNNVFNYANNAWPQLTTSSSLISSYDDRRSKTHLHLAFNAAPNDDDDEEEEEEDRSAVPEESTTKPKPTKFMPSLFLTTIMVFVNNNNKIGGTTTFDHFLTTQNIKIIINWYTVLILIRASCGLMYNAVYPFFSSDDKGENGNENNNNNISMIPNNKSSRWSSTRKVLGLLFGLYMLGVFQFILREIYVLVPSSTLKETRFLPISIFNTLNVLYFLSFLIGTTVYLENGENSIDPTIGYRLWTQTMRDKFPLWKFSSDCLKSDGFSEGIENIEPSIVLAIFLTCNSPRSFVNISFYIVFVISRLYTTIIKKHEPFSINIWQFLITILIGIFGMELLAMLN